MTGAIRRFLATLETTASPILLPYTDVSGDYRAGYCLDNCEAETQRSGHPTVFGWVIWEDRRQAFIEAEFHAVIRRGPELIDITPRTDGERVVLFALDPARSALRINARTWATWSNHKSQYGMVFESTRPLDIEDLNASVHA